MNYPIWNQIKSCIYANNGKTKGNKSYGVREHSECEVYIGTSAKNSRLFLIWKVTHRLLNNGDREYRFYIDDKIIKTETIRKREK